MKQVCKRQIENTGPELFGEQAIKAVSERVNTLETFSKTASRSEVKLRQHPKRFFFRDQEVHNLLQKRAIEECHDQGGFYSSFFIIPKKAYGEV